MAEPTQSGGGLFDTIRRMLDSALALVQNRLQLFAVELQEEKVRLFDLLLRLAAVAVLGLLALIAATATIVVWLWDTSPTLVLAVITLIYAVAAALIWAGVRKRLRDGPTPFADTLGEFKKDRECFHKRD
jgi:uncharacterized membrane protein YqjE